MARAQRRSHELPVDTDGKKQLVIKRFLVRNEKLSPSPEEGKITDVAELTDGELACLMLIRYHAWFSLLGTHGCDISGRKEISEHIRLAIRLMQFPDVPNALYFHERELFAEAEKRQGLCDPFIQLRLLPNAIRLVGNDELRLFLMQKLRRWHNRHALRNNEFIQHRLILEHAYVLVGGQDTLDTGEFEPSELQSEALARSLRRTKNLANF